MIFLMTHLRHLWILCLVLGFVCGSLFWYRQQTESVYEEKLEAVRGLTAQQNAFLKDRAFFNEKKGLLSQMAKQKFVCDPPPSYPELKDLILLDAKACHFEKIRVESAPPRRLENLHHRPVILYFQTALDTDLYGFLTRLETHLPAVVQWTFLSLFETADGHLQGEVHGDLMNHAP
ncbi:MAG: hypothetical protein ACK5TR_04435 [Alphaproteobacteria bacterium]|jgi:hypothetical protein|nr:hypothetical protein [Alphaproteobacteria bacterium]